MENRNLKTRLSTLGLTFALGLGSVLFPNAKVWAASSHSRLSENTYQLADGTAITNILARGIDVSHWQGEIDWQQVAQNDIEFVMLGTRYQRKVDPRFHINASEAANAGLKLGAYLYSYALTVEEAEAEADFILDLIKDYPISYPVAFDIEDNSQKHLSPVQVSALINAFCKKIEEAGYYPIVYANDYWLTEKIDLSQMDYDVWVARYETQHVFENPVMWQVTSTGSVDGITGNVDIDFQYQDFSEKLPSELWRSINGKRYYYKDYVMQKNMWIYEDNSWYFLSNDGTPAVGLLNYNDALYYLDSETGKLAQGWVLSSDGWRYCDANGVIQTGWIMDQNVWYHINADGLMSQGLIEDNGVYYFLRDSGAMATGWRMIDDNWYYFNSDGAMQTGWIGDSHAWYYLNPENGKMFVNTQIVVDNVLYEVDENGVCREVASEPAQTTTTTEASPIDEEKNATEAPLVNNENSTIQTEAPVNNNESVENNEIPIITPFP